MSRFWMGTGCYGMKSEQVVWKEWNRNEMCRLSKASVFNRAPPIRSWMGRGFLGYRRWTNEELRCSHEVWVILGLLPNLGSWIRMLLWECDRWLITQRLRLRVGKLNRHGMRCPENEDRGVIAPAAWYLCRCLSYGSSDVFFCDVWVKIKFF